MDLGRIEGRFGPTEDGKCAVADGGMVATAFPLATRAGVRMLERGGNAVDAACAAAFALSVCEPHGSGLGGQAMAMVHIDGRTIALDGSSRVPSLTHLDRLDKNDRSLGYRSATVPSLPAFLGYLHLRYGRMDWPTVIEPAIDIARNGYAVSALQNRLQNRELDLFFGVPSRSGARYFLKDGLRPYDAGDLFVQPELAGVLEVLADQGPRAFYLGDIARRISDNMEANGGFLRADDLALIPWPIERPILERSYRDISVRTIPPPAAGRSLLLVLLMLNHISSQFLAQDSPRTYHLLAETFRKAFLRRRQHPIDPNHYSQSPDKPMIDPVFARKLIESIRETIDPGLPLRDFVHPGGETTHLSIMDHEGNAVGISQSIESIFGSKAAAEGLGFMYNNYLNTMEIKDPSHPYYIRPNAVPWSSVAPTIMFLKNQPWLVVGSPGSERIFSTVSQFLIHMVDGGMSMAEAVRHPRLHCSMGGRISLEAERFDPAIIDHLEALGYEIDRRQAYSFYLGAIQAVMKCRTRKGFHGVAEVRRDGTADGP